MFKSFLVAFVGTLALIIAPHASALEIEDYDRMTNLFSRYSHSKGVVMAEVRIAQTNQNTGEENEAAIAKSETVLDQYVTAYRARCITANGTVREFCKR